MTPDSVEKEYSGQVSFFIVKQQIRPVIGFIKSYFPYPTANRSLYLGFHWMAVTCLFLDFSVEKLQRGRTEP